MRVYGDFNQVDAKGRVVLSYTDGTKSERVQLTQGLHVIVWDEELEAEGVLEFEDGKWRARLLPGTGRSRRKEGG